MRRQARIALAVAVAGVSTALLLAGCSSDSGDGATSTPSTSTATATATADTGGDSGTPDAKSGKLEGSWLATTGGKAVALVITGKQAALFATGGAVCSGTAGEESGMQMIRLKCTDGSKDRGIGMVDSVDSTSMKVTWEGGVGAETYTKSEGGQLPSGLPTAGLGS
ncbi:hypothetical protein BIV24_18945 [Streptomyces colonosanans]|uniref:Lipoprotein n=2 Tax=Streptomyces colonosanans TaxID=1428652 RepID=A0A1S2P9K4_9ACTN|nr:hypothetical protein [Streptomyces colonosanans]OIJ89704.1 hypothetical protein BIV24_18945 [Streptomyces colonosanans]